MKKYSLFALLLLVAFGLNTAVIAQGTGKKKKKSKAKTEETAAKAAADEAAAAGAAGGDGSAAGGTTAATVPPPPPPPDGILDTSHSDGLVADSSSLAYLDFPMDSTRPVDGMYKIPLLRGARPFAFPKTSRHNVKFYKRIWRTIDLTDSSNKIFCVPGESLMQIIMESLKSNKIVAYRDETFRSRLTYEQVMKAFSDSTVVPDLDTLTGEVIGSHAVFNPFNPDSIIKFEMKEDIFFDKTRGRIVNMIVGLSPVKRVKSSTGDLMGEQHPFWLYFDQCRTVFASREIYDTQRDIYNISYDDIFIQRNFKTVIVKESNPADLRIKDKYPDEADQKKEADRIEAEIKHYKKNVWKY